MLSSVCILRKESFTCTKCLIIICWALPIILLKSKRACMQKGYAARAKFKMGADFNWYLLELFDKTVLLSTQISLVQLCPLWMEKKIMYNLYSTSKNYNNLKFNYNNLSDQEAKLLTWETVPIKDHFCTKLWLYHPNKNVCSKSGWNWLNVHISKLYLLHKT